MSDAPLARLTIALALLFVAPERGRAGFQAGPPDLTPVLEKFAKRVNEATKNRNELQLKQAVEEFHREIAKFEGKEVRCEFKTILVKPHRVLLDNPILSDKSRYRFVFLAGDARSLARINDLDLEAATDQVIVAGVRQPLAVNEKLASMTEKAAGRLKAGDPVVIRGTLQPRKVDKYGSHSIHFVNARVVEP